MIQANELRIGNWVKWISTEKLEQVKKIDATIKGHIHVNQINISDCEPIPLTEEILLKCGFKFNGWNYETPLYKFHFQSKDKNGNLQNTEFSIRTSKQEGFIVSCNIKYLHQLQNLYFALTGKELEIKL